MSEMNDPKVYVVSGGERLDVTEEVKTVLDLLHSSLDWGSGFLCAEDMEAWAKIAGALGMDIKGVEEYVAEMRENDLIAARLDKERKQFRRPRLVQVRTADGQVLNEFVQEMDTGIQWEPPVGRRKVFHFWENFGAGWRDLGRIRLP